MSKLLSLFDDKLKRPGDLVASAPQTLETISTDVEEQDYTLKKLRQLEIVEPKIDYSDFSNFVFFNSALDYFNITGEKILNEYPYGGSRNAIEAFRDDLDGYQRHVLDRWPRNSGHIKFDPAVSSSYIEIKDVGVEDGHVKTGRLGPSITGSFTFECWVTPPLALTGTEDVMILFQKLSASNDIGLYAYFTGSELAWGISASIGRAIISTPVVPGVPTFVSCVYDQTLAVSSSLSIITGSANKFPVEAVSLTDINIYPGFYYGTTPVYIGSGSLFGKVTRPLTASLDDVRLWNTIRTVSDCSSSFNTKIYSQKNLLVNLRCNETSSVPSYDADSSILNDSSGHRYNGKIHNYHYTLRQSGSLLPFDIPDPILTIKAPEVRSHILEQQNSGSAYDNSNDNLITRLLPEQFFQLEEFKNTNVLRDFLYILARQFDQIKQRIDQFVNVLKVDYGNFDQTPDALLAEVGKFFGWEFTGNFLNASTSQYLFGNGVLTNLESNKELDTKLYEIKNEFWKRTLINLMYIYKTKGTRESVESLFRVYGVNKNFVKLKEYGIKPAAGIQTFRIAAEKSYPSITFGSGSTKSTNFIKSKQFDTNFSALQFNVKFPTTSSSDLQATTASGTVLYFDYGSGNILVRYMKDSYYSTTGTIGVYNTSSSGLEVMGKITGAAAFDNEWYNVSFSRDAISTYMSVRSLPGVDVRKNYVFVSGSSGVPSNIQNVTLFAGVSGTGGFGNSEFWLNELRMWDTPLSASEIIDHTENFQSFGKINPLEANPVLHWRLDEDVTFNASGFYSGINDFSTHGVTGSASGFTANGNPYKKHLMSYNFIASPDYGWNEDKVRVISNTYVSSRDAFVDNSNVALEFNMIDALNEDISRMIATMDNFNNYIGAPVNRYRATYVDLENIRREYFSRLQGNLNFRLFADMLEFFDRSFIDMVRRLIPVRANFLGDEFVVESHMLERPKLQWNYRRQERSFETEGRIAVLAKIFAKKETTL